MQIRPPYIHKIKSSTDSEALRTDHSSGFPSDLMWQAVNQQWQYKYMTGDLEYLNQMATED
jgi:hypothetical protein